MTPDSPVSGPIRLNFSQNNVELVSRVFGAQVLRCSFQPFRCSRRLYEMYLVVSPRSCMESSQREGTHRCADATGCRVGLRGRLGAVLRSFGYLTSGLRWGGRIGVKPSTPTIHTDSPHKKRLRRTRSSRDGRQRSVVKGMRKDGSSLSLEFGNVGNGGRGNLVLFFSHLLNSVCFLILGLVHNDLCFFLLGVGGLRVPFIVTTLRLLPKMEFRISAILDRPWPPVTMPVFSWAKP